MSTRDRADRVFALARIAQEHVIRWVLTLVLIGCAVAFCTGLGAVSGSASIGQFAGAVFAGVPAVWLWGREFHEARIRRERAQFVATPSRFNAEVGIGDPEPERPAPAEVRTTYYGDDEDDD